MQKFFIIVTEKLKINMLQIKNILKLETIVIIQVNMEVLNVSYIT